MGVGQEVLYSQFYTMGPPLSMGGGWNDKTLGTLNNIKQLRALWEKWHTSCISVPPPLFPSFAFFLVVLITFDRIFTISPAPSHPPLGSLPCPRKHHHFLLPSAVDLWPFSLELLLPPPGLTPALSPPNSFNLFSSTCSSWSVHSP